MMATTHLPSIMQSHAFGASFEHPLKTDKLFNTDDHEYEISKWLKLENDPLLSGPNTFADLGSDALLSSSNSITYTTANSQAAIQDFPASYYTSAFTFSAPSANNTSSPQLPPPLPNPQFSASTNQRQIPQPVALSTQPTFTYTFTPVSQSTPQQYSTAFPASFQALQYAQYTSQFAPAYSSTQAQYTFTTTTPQYEASNPQFIQIATTPQYTTQTTSVVPSQLFQQQPSYGSPASEAQASISPQYQYVYQYPVVNKNSIVNAQGDELLLEDKKRKANPRPVARRVRQTRPKVVEAKGAVQCKGRNRKKGTQCRNAALMEYIGPRPIYCAEHIELDPKSLYEKCKSSYQKDPGDNKGCKEVVLKEFGVCYKHYTDLVSEMIENREYDRIRKHSDRITELLAQLERDAAAAKKKDGDLYQRKNKLIPKFQEMKKQALKALGAVDVTRHKDFEDDLPSELAQLSAPIVLDGISVHIVEALSSESDDDLSSPQSDSSLEDEFDQILN